MNKILLIVSLVLIFITSCNRNKVRIEKFVWIQHNQNWISSPADLKANNYLDYSDSSKKIRLSSGFKHPEYFVANAPDSLRDLIISNLYSKQFPICFKDSDSIPPIYDGDFYCIIYKFSNCDEQILNYKPFNIPDSLKCFTEYLESLLNINSYLKTDSFDKTSLINKYRDIIISCSPMIFAPPLDSEVGKYSPPKIIDTIK